jgi:hypothetical protein
VAERTAEQYAASTNGRVQHVDETVDGSKKPSSKTISSMIVPIVLIATALIVLRRMQRGNYA